MVKQDIISEYNRLCDLLLKYSHHYYILDQPLVSDAKYDSLYQKFLRIEEEVKKDQPNLVRSDSPSSQVGAQLDEKGSKVAHEPPMLSLDNIFSKDDLIDFNKRCLKKLGVRGEKIEYSVELKFDGLAVEIAFRDKVLFLGSTRGDGFTGENITNNVKTIKDIPKKIISNSKNVTIRGEVYMTQSEFERLNKLRQKKGEEPFANPRNAAAGSLRLLDSDLVKARELKVNFYGLGQVPEELNVNNQIDLFNFFEKNKIPFSKHFVIGGLEEINNFYHYWIVNRHKLDFDIDGVVIKVNDFGARDEIGYNLKAPKWAVAWKFPAEEAITTLQGVDYQVGRTGIITPVANLEPVNIGGVLVKRATLHNFKEVARLGVKIGDQVKVIRAGDVIPKITMVYKASRKGELIVPPEKCPYCNSLLAKEDIFYRCLNLNCTATQLEKLKFFVSKGGLDLEFFGPELILRLYQTGKLKDLADFYKLKISDLLNLDRMGEKLADKIIHSIEQKKEISLSLFLKILGLRNVGAYAARIVAQNFISLDVLKGASIEQLSSLRGIGPEVSKSIFNFFNDPRTKDFIDRLISLGVKIKDEQPLTEKSPLAGKKFVFTGKLDEISRLEARKSVEKLGGRSSETVSSKIDYLVIGEKAGSKLAKAKKLGVKVITEAEFLALVSTL